MPFPNEHAARQFNPDQSPGVTFRRTHPAGWPAGLDAIWQIKDGKTALQSIRSDRKKWTPAKFKDWLKGGGLKHDVEEATEKGTIVAEGMGAGRVYPQVGNLGPDDIDETQAAEVRVSDLPASDRRKLARLFDSHVKSMKPAALLATARKLAGDLAVEVAETVTAEIAKSALSPQVEASLRFAPSALIALEDALSTAQVEAEPDLHDASTLGDRAELLVSVLKALEPALPAEALFILGTVQDAAAVGDVLAARYATVPPSRDDVYKAAASEVWEA